MNDAQYGYDKTSQLVSAEYNDLPKELYDYDANGNRKPYETGRNNQLLSDGIFEYQYDAEGNRIMQKSKSGEVTQYEWDHRNRLMKVVMKNEKNEYEYDFRNRLVKRNDEFFVHDGWQIAMVLDKIGTVKEKNLWGANQDELLCENGSWTLCDHLGTVRDVIGAEGNVKNHLEYNAFGKLIKANEKSLPRFRYTGKPFDDAIDLQWNINRWYDAEVGRWISEDPIGFSSHSYSLYAYVSNSPIFQNDHKGLRACTSTAPDISNYICCNKYSFVWKELGFVSHLECGNEVDRDNWWEERGWVVVIAGAGLAITIKNAPPHVSIPAGVAVFTLAVLSLAEALNFCNSYFCVEKNEDAVSCACTCAGCVFDKWVCGCSKEAGLLDKDQMVYGRKSSKRSDVFWRARPW